MDDGDVVGRDKEARDGVRGRAQRLKPSSGREWQGGCYKWCRYRQPRPTVTQLSSSILCKPSNGKHPSFSFVLPPSTQSPRVENCSAREENPRICGEFIRELSPLVILPRSRVLASVTVYVMGDLSHPYIIASDVCVEARVPHMPRTLISGRVP